MRLCDFVIYTLTVQCTRTIYHRDPYDGDVTSTSHTPAVETVEIMAPNYDGGEELARAWLLNRYKYNQSTDVTITKVEKRPAPAAWIQTTL